MAEDNQQLEAEKKQGFKYRFKKGGRVSPSVRKVDTRLTAAAGKLVHLAAPKGSFVRAITKPKGKGKRGRGRPHGTFKTRVLPSARVVKVHTSVYKKLLAQEKAQMRLIRVQRQFEAEQVATQQDPRFQAGAEEQFLTEPDQIHEARVTRAQQEAERAQFEPQRTEPQRRPGLIRRAVDGISGLRRPRTLQIQQTISYDEYGRPVIQPAPLQRPQVQDMRPREPRVNVLSEKSSILNEKSSILNAPNIFGNPGQSDLARKGR